MTDFRDRERAEEFHWSLEQEDAFRIRAVRDRLLGLWAAAELGFDEDRALAYAGEVIAMDVEKGQGAMVAKIIGDFGSRNLPVMPGAVERLVETYEQAARWSIAGQV